MTKIENQRNKGNEGKNKNSERKGRNRKKKEWKEGEKNEYGWRRKEKTRKDDSSKPGKEIKGVKEKSRMMKEKTEAGMG